MEARDYEIEIERNPDLAASIPFLRLKFRSAIEDVKEVGYFRP